MKFPLVVVFAALIATLVNGYSFSEIKTDAAPTSATRSEGRTIGTDLPPDEESRIYGGSNANIGNHMYMAGLRAEGPDSDPFCGGTLIAPQYILTAGHCFEFPMYDVYVSLGSKYRSGKGSRKSELIRVAEAFRHPLYRMSNNFTAVTHAVGLLKLDALKNPTSAFGCCRRIGQRAWVDGYYPRMGISEQRNL